MTNVGVPVILISSVARFSTASMASAFDLILEARHRLVVGEAGRSHGGVRGSNGLSTNAHLSC